MNAPGKGPWALDATHFPKPVSPYAAEIYSTAFPRGLAEATARYGLMLDTIAYAAVDGRFYNQVRIVGAPAGAAVPPRPIFFLATRLHPAIRRRTRVAATLFEDRPWRADIARWHGEVKPQRVRAHLGLLAEPVATFTDAQLLEHLGRCLAVYAESARIHGFFTIPSMVPVGDLIAHATGWTGLKPPEVLAALATSSPISAGSEPTRDALVDLARTTSAARAALQAADEPQAVLERLCQLPNGGGATARAYLDGVGYRTLSSYDVVDPYALEVPYVIVESLKVLVERTAVDVNARAEQSLAQVRDRVPAAHREQFDGLLAEARLTSSIRDERVLFNDYWSAGVTRRALLELGRRLVAKGTLASAAHATVCSAAELAALVEGRAIDGPTPAARWEARQRSSFADVPQTLGPPEPAPPPVAWLPPDLRRAQRATMACIDAIFSDTLDESSATTVKGFGASPGSYQGTARVISGAHEFHRLRPGDVLVTRSTSPTYNVVLPMLGGIVTDRGGALSHAAIVSREFGIPGIVGCKNATALIPDGASVLVDGSRGECRVLA